MPGIMLLFRLIITHRDPARVINTRISPCSPFELKVCLFSLHLELSYLQTSIRVFFG